MKTNYYVIKTEPCPHIPVTGSLRDATRIHDDLMKNREHIDFCINMDGWQKILYIDPLVPDPN